MRVLVIESDPSIAGVLAELLADEGHATGGAATSADGLARARAGAWDACVTDGFWPEAVDEGRAYLADLSSCCPVILLSARDWARHARPGDLGVAAVVPKPFDLDDLLDALDTISGTAIPTATSPAAAREPAPVRAAGPGSPPPLRRLRRFARRAPDRLRSGRRPA
jgi:DNA-binding response OmpR family regulator